MIPHNTRQALIDAINEDPYNAMNHFAYADWLEEYGDKLDDVEEMKFQRAWTKEREEAEAEACAWLENYANDVLQMSYEKLMAAAERHVETGRRAYLGFETPDLVYAQNDTFWECYELVTHRSVVEDKKHTFFSCSC